jgi:hypothetical protein
MIRLRAARLWRKLLITAMLPLTGYAQYERPGSSTAQFLDIGVSPRAEAMAGAYVSVAEGAEGAFYNPAAMARTAGTDIAFSVTRWFADINHEFFALAHNVGGDQVIALSVTALQTDEMLVRTPLQPDGTGETFYAGNYRFGISFARALTDRVSIGITGNYVTLYLYKDFHRSAYAGDIGILYDTGTRNIKFGFLLANFGSSVTFVHESYPMPTSFAFGISANALEFTDHRVMISVAARKPNDGGPKGTIGAEYSFQDLFFVRGGYHDDEVKTFAVGAGIKVRLDSYALQADFSYTEFRLLGGTQRFGLKFHF